MLIAIFEPLHTRSSQCMDVSKPLFRTCKQNKGIALQFAPMHRLAYTHELTETLDSQDTAAECPLCPR